MPLLTDLCLAMQPDPLRVVRGLGEVMTCVHGPEVNYAFPDPLITTYRHSVVHVSLISTLDETALNWCVQGNMRTLMSETVLFGIFRGQLPSRISGKQEGPIEA